MKYSELNTFVRAMNDITITQKQHICVYQVLKTLIDLGFKPTYPNCKSSFIFKEKNINLKVNITFHRFNIKFKFTQLIKIPKENKTVTNDNCINYDMSKYKIVNIEPETGNKESFRLVKDMKNDIKKYIKKQVPILHALIRKNKIKKILKK